MKGQLDYNLEIYHIPSKLSVKFPAFIETFEDSYAQEWKAGQVVGRNDPHMTFSNTARTITISVKVPAESVGESIENHRKMSLLAQMQYPVYKGGQNNALTIQGSPIFKVKFLNWITDGAKPYAHRASAEMAGLVCTMSGIKFGPNIDAGFLFNTPRGDEFDFTALPEEDFVLGQVPMGEMYAKEFTLSFELKILHSHKLGWVQGKGRLKFRSDENESFPYGIGAPSEPTVTLNAGDIINGVPDPDYEGATSGPNPDVAAVKTSFMLEN
jgi:hypothetical protein